MIGRTSRALAVVAGIVAVGGSRAAAQGAPTSAHRAFITVDAGAQPQRRNFETGVSFPIYGETATVRTRQHVGNGPVLDVNGGYRVWRRLAVGAGASSFRKRGGGIVGAMVPDRLFFNQPRAMNVEVSGLQHDERAIYAQASWVQPVGGSFEVSLSAGPSLIRVVQQVVATATIGSGAGSLTPVLAAERAWAHGVNAGIDVGYAVASRFRPLVFVRFNGATAHLPSVADLNVGGLQTGIGGRFQF